jgi:putative methyltransferase (TIGR04325 family)
MSALNASASLGRIKRVIKKLPLVERAQQLRYQRQFAGDCYGCFQGVFESFEAAARSAPRTKHVGFDHPDYPTHHLDRMHTVESHDYPAMLWLRSILGPGSRVFDFGGNVGVSYYAYARYIDYPPDLRWTVCEMPGMVQAGREIAAREGRSNLSFTEDWSEASGADVYFSAGVIQYIDTGPFAEGLVKLQSLPRHVLLNKLPLYDGEQFVTLQNSGAIVNPQFVFNRDAFLESMSRLSYRLIDSWAVHGYSCFVPFHPDKHVPTYSGLYFRLDV